MQTHQAGAARQAGRQVDTVTTYLLLGVHERLEVNNERCAEVATSLSIKSQQLFTQLSGNDFKQFLTPLDLPLALHIHKYQYFAA